MFSSNRVFVLGSIILLSSRSARLPKYFRTVRLTFNARARGQSRCYARLAQTELIALPHHPPPHPRSPVPPTMIQIKTTKKKNNARRVLATTDRPKSCSRVDRKPDCSSNINRGRVFVYSFDAKRNEIPSVNYNKNNNNKSNVVSVGQSIKTGKIIQYLYRTGSITLNDCIVMQWYFFIFFIRIKPRAMRAAMVFRSRTTNRPARRGRTNNNCLTEAAIRLLYPRYPTRYQTVTLCFVT